MPLLNWADWTIVAIVAVSSLFGLMRGFIKEALSLLVWVVATCVAIAFHERLALVLDKWISTPSIRTLLAYAALFIGTLVIGSLITRLLHSLVEASGLGGLDLLLGMVFGALRGVLLVLAIVILLPLLLPVKQDPWWYHSTLIAYFEQWQDFAMETYHKAIGLSETLTHKLETAAPPAGAH